MCGRFVRKSPIEAILEEFEIDEVELELEPSYNISPSHQVLAVVNDGRNRLASLRWGLVPSWAADQAIGNRLINARAETLADKPSFRGAFKKRRCAIVADGFYEWKKTGDKKTPLYFTMGDGRPFGMAGLYEHWQSPEGRGIGTCTIITTSPNKLMQPVHDRMPAILSKAGRSLWLDRFVEDAAQLHPLLAPFPDAEMKAYPVGLLVNSPKHDSPDCIAPIDEGPLVR